MKSSDLKIYSQRLDAIVEFAHDGVISIDTHKHITFMNASACKMFGYTTNEVQTLALMDLIPKQHKSNHDNLVDDFYHSQTTSQSMQSRKAVEGLRKDGNVFPLEISISKIRVNGEIEMVGILRDISVRTEMMKKLEYAAAYDDLTGLVNKREFNHEAEQHIALSKRYDRPLSLLLIDLDHFKNVNDTYGHNFGDEVLIQLAALLKQEVRESDLPARWGGEEFIILLPETSLEGALILAEKLRLQIASNDFVLSNEVFTMSASFGAVEMQPTSENLTQLFERADTLLYRAKNKGRNRVEF